MVNDRHRLATTPRGGDGPPAPAAARPVPGAAIEDLRWLRQRVLERLDAIEALARRHPRPAAESTELAARERMLRQQEAELEEARLRLRAEADRQAKEWAEALEQLDADRRLLADAWERLERERLEGPGGSEGRLPRQARSFGPTGVTASAPVGAAAQARIDTEPDNPVARAILRQFEALGRDVRSAAEARHDPS
jgi:exonuclease VII large subunit